ncbi:MAG: ferric reductase-like transmembrane domain-containing protein [Desulfobulbus sp.]|nr:ferric reductase-like transmembrane domain-containing protein [Desulfobulbus sp.]
MQHTDIHTSQSAPKGGKLPIFGGVILFAAATLSVPIFYPTETLWYKMGLDKLMLQAGQIAGLLTLNLVVLQILLALRPRFMDRAFGAAKLLRWHRANGLLVAAGAMVHVLLILAPEGLSNLPFGWEYWPEMVGALTLFTLLTTVGLSHYRTRLQLNYQHWRAVHRPLGYLILLLLALHVLFVSESFSAGLPRIGLHTVVICTVFGSASAWIRRGRKTPTNTTTA